MRPRRLAQRLAALTLVTATVLLVGLGCVACGVGAIRPRAARGAVQANLWPSSRRRLALTFVTGPGPGVPQVWLAGVTGAHPRRLGEGDQPLLSPNGHLVAAMAIEGPRALIVYCSAGGASRVL